MKEKRSNKGLFFEREREGAEISYFPPSERAEGVSILLIGKLINVCNVLTKRLYIWSTCFVKLLVLRVDCLFSAAREKHFPRYFVTVNRRLSLSVLTKRNEAQEMRQKLLDGRAVGGAVR